MPASFAMIVGYFRPNEPHSMEDGIRITAKPSEKAPWPFDGPLWLVRSGFEVRVIFAFDYAALAREGINYIRRKYGQEVANWQEQNGAPFTKEVVEQFLREVPFEQREPTFDDIRNALKDGCLVRVSANSKRLNGEDGYVGHSVVVYALDDDFVELHNPGPPPQPGQRVAVDLFEQAWHDDGRYFMSVRDSRRLV